MSSTARRLARELPYREEHAASAAAAWDRGGRPSGLDALVAWFVRAWDHEPPSTLHAAGPWFAGTMEIVDGQPVRVPFELVGGSVLGTPRWSEPFRAWLTSSPSALDEDGSYRWPMRAAVWRLGTGTPRRDARPLSARYCYALGQVRGDWRLINDRSPYPVDEEILRPFWESTLLELWYLYRPGRAG